MAGETSDEELIAGCLQGDAAAWSRFVERFSRLVHWAIRRSVDAAPSGGREEFCRETFQEFFERLIDRNELSKLRETKNVRKFLTVMASHLVMDRLKALSRRSKKLQPLDGLESPETVQAPADEACEQALQVSLQGLSAKERACLEFYFVEEKTAGEIGRLLGLPEDTVRSTVRRAKEKLKEELAKKGFSG